MLGKFIFPSANEVPYTLSIHNQYVEILGRSASLSSELFGGHPKVIEAVPAAARARLKKSWTQTELPRRVGPSVRS